MFVVYVYTGSVMWNDALTASSHGYYWRELGTIGGNVAI